ncbi:MAG: tryptophan-rich sensory protein [Paracoccus sp. (in: a-proteobacteria)]|nr:tryptophan-rich sensory protein [Paracoccus sp. (in: a-proteobacteria)]
MAIILLIGAIAFALSPVIFPEFAGYRPDLFPIRQDQPPVQPAGWAFSIWGVIYAWLILAAGYGLLRSRDSDAWRPARLWLLGSLLVGFFWIPVANRMPGLATLMILAMLTGAAVAMLRAPREDPWRGVLAIGLYAGWLTAASAVSIGIWLAGHGWLAPVPAAIVCLAGAAALAFWLQTLRPDVWTYGAAVVWALVGVLVNNLDGRSGLVAGLAAILTLALLGRIWMGLRRI